MSIGRAVNGAQEWQWMGPESGMHVTRIFSSIFHIIQCMPDIILPQVPDLCPTWSFCNILICFELLHNAWLGSFLGQRLETVQSLEG
ncbi:hypothetical protein BJ165DRAFT_101569 [Panaeolus papilionaceus]|nr:hypothetical protein BJ165DRAFT_101569 [Panaeolus papilionaceus]